jgi:hypothetical protein
MSIFRPRMETEMAMARAEEANRQAEAARIARASRQARPASTRSSVELVSLAN